jgi:hypothetical protein
MEEPLGTKKGTGRACSFSNLTWKIELTIDLRSGRIHLSKESNQKYGEDQCPCPA